MSINEKQELLLEKYYDKQCTFVEKFFAKRLIATNNEASVYLNKLEKTSTVLQRIKLPTLNDAFSLRTEQIILKNLDSEKALKMALVGQTIDGFFAKTLVEIGNVMDIIFPKPTYALVPALGLFAISLSMPLLRSPTINSVKQIKKVEVADDQPSQTFHQISQVKNSPGIGSDYSNPLSASTAFNGLSDMDVHWIRSDGSVQFYKDPSMNSPVIWVKKRGRLPTGSYARTAPEVRLVSGNQ